MKLIPERTQFFARKLGLELVVYAILVTVYFLLVLRVLGQPLHTLLDNHLSGYALASVMLVLLQAVGLDYLTTWIVRRFYVEPLEEKIEE